MKIGKAIIKGLKVISGVNAYEERREAKKLAQKIEEMEESINTEDAKVRKELEESVTEFGQARLNAAKNIVGRFLTFLSLMEKKAKGKEYEILDSLNMDKIELQKMSAIHMNASTALGIAGASSAVAVAALSGVPTLVTSTVGALATASTGTAISSLSGAAATNATLAWLGGGAVSAGGGGMAAGAAVLSGITYATTGVFALAAAGIISSAYYSKKHTEAEAKYAQLREMEAKYKENWRLIRSINQRVKELHKLTNELAERATPQLDMLEPLAIDFLSNDPYYIEVFQKCALLAKSMSELCQVSVLSDDGLLSKQSSEIKIKVTKVLNNNLIESYG